MYYGFSLTGNLSHNLINHTTETFVGIVLKRSVKEFIQIIDGKTGVKQPYSSTTIAI
jgi:uncharacterized protein (DUF697 family)